MENAAMERRTILVAGKDPEIRSHCEIVVQSLGYAVKLIQNGSNALPSLTAKAVHAVLLAVAADDPMGLEPLRTFRATNPELPVIVVSASASPEHVVRAMKMGAADFVCKPADVDRLSTVLRPILESLPPRPSESGAAAEQVFEGTCSSICRVQALVGRIGWSEAPVLIQGETGTGKEVIARQLHERSRRSGKAFLKINCAALPSELIESELFGYERGAFTGAMQRKRGLFEEANGGTLLLDEIGDMDYRLQSKLLHILQDNSFLRVGGRELIRVDVRVMAATHCNLENAIANGTFRQDLFYRLNVININLPPLRNRKEDLPALTSFLMRKHATPGVPVPVLTPELEHAVISYDWPGNIRELENWVRKLLIFGDADMVARDLIARVDVPAKPVSETPATCVRTGRSVLEEIINEKQQAEADAILSALNRTCWNRRRASALLQIDYKSLLFKMKKLGIGPSAVAVSRAGGDSC